MQNSLRRVAILYPGDREVRQNATPANNRFAGLFAAFTARGTAVEPAVYHDDYWQEVRDQLVQVDGVLVWVNPIEGGHDRSILDAMLREVAAAGVFVSTHPDVILKLGTKEVLYQTRDLGWGSDTYLYRSLEQMRDELPPRLAAGNARVLKQYRGNGGNGVWKIQCLPDSNREAFNLSAVIPQPETLVRVRHAKRGSIEQEISLAEFYTLCEEYFTGDGRMIDQQYQERLPEGMIRCYLVQDKVAGFGHQAVNALFPAPQGATPAAAPEPGPRIYHPPTKPAFQELKNQLEQQWVPDLQHLLALDTVDLPILWDCDFLLGPQKQDSKDTYVLCEINVSSVAPYPESAVPHIVEATMVRVQEARRQRGLAP